MHLQVQSASNAGTAQPQTRHVENWHIENRHIENQHIENQHTWRQRIISYTRTISTLTISLHDNHPAGRRP